MGARLKSWLQIVFAALLLAASGQTNAESAISAFVGFLEDRPVEDPVSKGFGNRQVFEAYMRVAFVKENGEWKGLCELPPFSRLHVGNCDLERRYTFPKEWLGFGPFENLEQIRLEKPADLEMGNWGLFEISGFDKPNREDDRQWVYGGHWHVPSHRPIVMSSTKQSTDPDGWTKSDLRSDAVPPLVAAHLQKTFSKLEKCVPGKPAREQPIQGELGMSLAAKNLRLREHHRAKSQLELWKVEIPGVSIRLCGNDREKYATSIRSQTVWVYRDRFGQLNSLLTPKWLANFGAFDKFELLSTRDLDADGKGEVAFWYSGYVHDGYVLFSEGMTRMVTFTWGYH